MAADDTTLRAYIALRDEFTPVLKGIDKDSKKYVRQIKNGFGDIADMAKTAGAALAGAAVAGGTVWYATTAAADTAVQLDQMSKQTGVAAERLQAWQAVAVASGMDADEFAESLRDMNIELSDAATGGKDELAQLLSKVGIAARDASGNIKTADQVFLDFADAVARQKDEAIQLRMAISAFGEDTGAKLLPLLKQGSKAFREYEASMQMTGMAVSQEQIDSLKSFRAEWESVKFSLSATSTSVLSELAPSFEKLASEAATVLEHFRPLINAKAQEWAKGLASAIDSIPWDTVIRKVDAFIEGGDRMKEEFGVVGEAVSFVMENIGTIAGLYLGGKGAKAALEFGGAVVGIAKSATELGKVVMPLIGKASPFGILAGLVAAVGSAVYENWDGIVAGTKDFVKDIQKIIDGVVGIFTGAVDSIKSGFKFVGDTIDSLLPDWFKEDVPTTKDILGSVSIGDDSPEGVRETAAAVQRARASADAAAVTPDMASEAKQAVTSPAEQQRFQATALRPPQQSQRIAGEITVGFSNAPQNLQLESARSSGGVTVGTTFAYRREGLGVNPYSPSYGDL